jgi:hypothetical protein
LLEQVRDGRPFRWVASTAAKRWVGVLLALYAFATDWLTGWHGMNFAMRGLLDSPAHLATALVILGTLVRVRRTLPDQRFGWTMLACSVLIDLDHLPAEFGSQVLINGTPRPYTHALWTVIVLALAWAATRFFTIRCGWPRPATAELILAGAASGVAAHFVRDIATAPMSFWWPLTDMAVQVPYWWFVAALAVFIVIGPARQARRCNSAAIATADDGDLNVGERSQGMTPLSGPQSLSRLYGCHTFTDLMASVPLHVPVPVSVSAKFMITYIAW